jgi:hypothetical protein
LRRLSSRLPSPAMIVAVLALFIALGGSAYAVKVANAPANSVVTKSIKKSAVTQTKIRPGAVGNAQLGADAVTGTNVAPKTITAGNIDVPSLNIPKSTTYTVRRTTVQNHLFAKDDQFQLLTACLPGETVTGGGGRTSNGRISLSESIPFTGATEQQWGVLFHNTTGEPLTEEVTAYAICASGQS